MAATVIVEGERRGEEEAKRSPKNIAKNFQNMFSSI